MNIVGTHRHLGSDDELVVSYDSHISRHSSYLLASYLVIELSSRHSSVTVLRANWIISVNNLLARRCRLVWGKFRLMLSAARFRLTATIILVVDWVVTVAVAVAADSLTPWSFSYIACLVLDLLQDQLLLLHVVVFSCCHVCTTIVSFYSVSVVRLGFLLTLPISLV